ncbi:MAG: twin-arginine translocase TatA/TatE family subunit [Conexivisphaera sp.]
MIGSATDIIIIIIVAVVLFAGANKIPEIFHSMGRAVGEYKKGKVESEMELSRMTEAPAQSQAAPSGSSETDERTKQLESQIAELQRQLQELKSKGKGGN